MVIQAFSGVMASNGEANSQPTRIGPPVIDYGTGAQAAFAISAALFGRERTGVGRYIDVAMSDAALMLMTMNVVTASGSGAAPLAHGNHDPANAAYSAYDTADGMVMLGAYSKKQYSDLMRALGHTSVANDVAAGTQADLRGRSEQDATLLKDTLMTKTADEWEKLLNAAHVPAARVRTLEEALEHPQIKSRTVMQDVDGLTGARPAAAFMFDQGGPKIDSPPPRFAADTKFILNELGVSDDRVAELAAQKVIAI